MEKLKSEVRELVNKELNRANIKFPMFNSPHEGIAVIYEEIEEAHDELELIDTYNKIQWTNIKTNDFELKYINGIKEAAIRLAAESIQVAAMAAKYEISAYSSMKLNKESEENDND